MDIVAKNVINLTPHDVVIGDTTISRSGDVARCKEHHELIGHLNGIEITSVKYGDAYISGKNGDKEFPEEKEGTAYIVSSITAQALKGRNDVFVPGDPVRDDAGRIIGCHSICKI